MGNQFGEVVYVDTDAIFVQSDNHINASTLNTMIHRSETPFKGLTDLLFTHKPSEDRYHKFFSNSRKSYIYSTAPININLKLPIEQIVKNYNIGSKSLQMNKVTDELKKDIFTFMAILLEHGIDMATIYKYQMLKWRINQMREDGDLTKYITPTKMSGKNKIVIEVKSKYDIHDDYAILVPVCNNEKLVAKQMIPLQYLKPTDKINWMKILQSAYQTCMGKLIKSDKKEEGKLLEQIDDDLDDYEIQVELIKNNGHRSLAVVNVLDIEKFVKAKRGEGIQTHEFIVGHKPVRFFMDIDSKTPIDLNPIIDRILYVATKLYAEYHLEPKIYICSQNKLIKDKYSYHLYGNFGFANIQQMNYFVRSLALNDDRIDMGVYTKNHTFRMCYSGKGGNNDRWHIPPKDIGYENCVIQHVDNIYILDSNILFENVIPMNFTKPHEMISGDDIDGVVDKLDIPVKSCKPRNNGSYYVTPAGPYTCGHGNKHNGRNNIQMRGGNMVAHCFSNKCKGKKDVVICSVDEKKIKKSKMEKIEQIMKNQRMEHGLEPTQNNKYLEFEDIELNG